ncbi:hypothetical protein RFI_38189 [Reticulomyxa filosa]|uniref:Replication factor C C-terminal domain-containing protein n=1 Tax=Reticulomyxa filosa TaxID=46433 RepID=X6LCM2_RETFI|nr:hypothetical protein RFI_38189 [Reticulomyxa filosa]|eukprot:ETN99293.1 hypothetical protein RFI_38189 [Reticulomyxa filosa]
MINNSPDLMRDRVLELNASDERGINVVREKVKQFAQYAVNDTNNEKQSPYPCPPFKIVILDEADNMTRDAQNALRRTMEKYSTVTRFCLICNYVSKIIAPVASRCAKFRFHSLTNESMKAKLGEIARNEDVKIEETAMNEIVEIANGDMRKSITLMQGAALMRPNDEVVRAEDVNAVAVRIPKDIIYNNIVDAVNSNSFDKVNSVCSLIISEGYPVPLVLSELLDLVISTSDLSTVARSELCIKLAESDKKLVDGASEQLQLLDVLASIAKAFNTSKRKKDF